MKKSDLIKLRNLHNKYVSDSRGLADSGKAPMESLYEISKHGHIVYHIRAKSGDIAKRIACKRDGIEASDSWCGMSNYSARKISAYKAGELEHELTPQEELKTLCKIATALGLSYGELIARVDNKKPLVEPKPAEVVEIKAELPEVVIEAIGAEMARLEVRIADDLKAIESKEAEIKLLKEANERRFGAIKELGAFVNDND